mgnify:CR=1 FL=1
MFSLSFFGDKMNPFDLLKMQKAWGSFSSEHPKFTSFISYIASHPIEVGDVISVAIEKGENGKKISSNMRVTEKDLELIHLLQSMGKKES